MAAETLVQVSEKQFSSGDVWYEYRVVSAPCPIVNLSIGFDAKTPDEGELTVVPLRVKSPEGWDGGVYRPENGGDAHVSWIKNDYSRTPIGASLMGFSVLVSHEESAYLQGHWKIGCLKSISHDIVGQLVIQSPKKIR